MALRLMLTILNSFAPVSLIKHRPHHSDLQCFDVELPDFPVVQDVTEYFDQPIDPEDACHDEEEYDPAVVLDPVEKQKGWQTGSRL